MTKTQLTIMGAAVLGLAVIIPVRARATPSAAEIAALSWNESNIGALRSASLADVEEFVNRVLCGDMGIKDCAPIDVLQFTWVDIEGNGKYALVDEWGGKFQGIGIYQRSSSSKIQENEGGLTPAIPEYTTQSIDLDVAEDLREAFRDLNGDGKKELIINTGFGVGLSRAETPLTQWPIVYRLRDGQFVEASREFPEFYDKEVLPPLEEKISALKKKLDSEADARTSGEAVMKQYHGIRWEIGRHISSEQSHALDDSEQLALIESLRDHISLVLGRRLAREQVEEARGWLKSSDSMILDDAEGTFEEMGGHEAEVREAEQAESGIFEDAHNALAEERKVSPAPAPSPAPLGSPIEMRPAQAN